MQFDGFLGEWKLKEGFERVLRHGQEQFAGRILVLEHLAVVQVLSKCGVKFAEGRTAGETLDFHGDAFVCSFGSDEAFRTEVNLEVCFFVRQTQRVIRDLPALFLEGMTNRIVKGISGHCPYCSSSRMQSWLEHHLLFRVGAGLANFARASSPTLESQSRHAQPTIDMNHLADAEAQITTRQHRDGSPDIFGLAPSWHRR